MKLNNIEIPIIAIILSLIILTISKNKKYKIDSTIANTEFIKNTMYYKKKNLKYYFLKTIFYISFIISLISSILILGKVSKTDYINIKNESNYILCIDVSSSNDEQNLSFIDNFKTTPDNRYGIIIFNTSAVNLSPLTYDYNYINNILSNIKKSIIANKNQTQDNLFIKNYIISGTLDEYEKRKTSLIGDGILSCINSFNKNDINKNIILSTDYLTAGNEIITVEKALEYGKNNNINIINASDNKYQINPNNNYIKKRIYIESLKVPFIFLVISIIIIIIFRRLFI